ASTVTTSSSSAGSSSSVTSSGTTTASTVTTSSSGAGSSSSVVASTSTATNDTSVMRGLGAAAQAECAQQASTCLTIYTTQDAGNWVEYYGPLFYQQFPWAQGKVDYVSWAASDETTHLLSDYTTKNVQADIATGTLAPLIPVYQGGAFLNYTSPEAKLMGYSADGLGPAWVVTDLALVHMVYNPTLLSASQVPKSWSDLANPIYSGKLAFQSATSLSITTAEFYYLYVTMGNSSGQWTNLMKGIAANHPMITSTAGAAETAVVNGQAAIGIDTFDGYVSTLKATPNAPLKIVDIQPMVYTPGVVAITAGAPHPAMAKLVEAWFISVSGQTGVYRTNHDPYTSELSGNLTSYLPSDYRLTNAYANTALFQNTGAWSDTFKAIFGA
ncbi:MAG: ABC transporter substrate-binding protein, partial [Thaumarchaeota archaeon]|nr:ABC transporter substrate-binding protein [Nitrososphaerota archaeon]